MSSATNDKSCNKKSGSSRRLVVELLEGRSLLAVNFVSFLSLSELSPDHRDPGHNARNSEVMEHRSGDADNYRRFNDRLTSVRPESNDSFRKRHPAAIGAGGLRGEGEAPIDAGLSPSAPPSQPIGRPTSPSAGRNSTVDSKNSQLDRNALGNQLPSESPQPLAQPLAVLLGNRGSSTIFVSSIAGSGNVPTSANPSNPQPPRSTAPTSNASPSSPAFDSRETLVLNLSTTQLGQGLRNSTFGAVSVSAIDSALPLSLNSTTPELQPGLGSLSRDSSWRKDHSLFFREDANLDFFASEHLRADLASEVRQTVDSLDTHGIALAALGELPLTDSTASQIASERVNRSLETSSEPRIDRNPFLEDGGMVLAKLIESPLGRRETDGKAVDQSQAWTSSVGIYRSLEVQMANGAQAATAPTRIARADSPKQQAPVEIRDLEEGTFTTHLRVWIASTSVALGAIVFGLKKYRKSPRHGQNVGTTTRDKKFGSFHV